MDYKIGFINKIAYSAIFVWSIFMLGAILMSRYHNYNYADKLAQNEAIVSVKKDLAYRSWIAKQGGVYVPTSNKILPNQYLSHIANRDINTTNNQELTLVNPAYILSEIMKEYTEIYKTKGHITSRKLLNPNNKADIWEEKALEKVEVTKEPLSTKEIINGKEYFRYLQPLITQKSCLKCHGHQGYKVGDVRGGVSISIPMEEYYKKALTHSLINEVAICILYLFGMLIILFARIKAKNILDNKIKNYEQHIFSLVNIIEKRDAYTAGHTQRVAKYAKLIAKEMGFLEDQIDDIYRACMLHDIGKISIPDSILLKPGKLTPLEYEIIKEHVSISYELLSSVDIYKDIAEIIRYHHERYDGSGYPNGLKEDEIPLMSHIMIVADAFDAMTTNRIYKSKKSVALAIKELQNLSGKYFHQDVVNSAVIVLSDIEVDNDITQTPRTKIEKERFSYFYKDQITQVYNKNYLEFVLASDYSHEFGVKYINSIYLHNFTQYNRVHGWGKGDTLLREFAQTLNTISYDKLVFRVYGDDFVILNRESLSIDKHLPILNKILEDTGVTLSYKSFDIHTITNLESLETVL